MRVAHGFDGLVVGVVDDAAERLNEWFQGLGESAIVVYDFKADWDLLALAMQGHENNRPMKQYAAALQLNNSTITHPEFEKGQQAAFSADWPQHLALAYARALLEGATSGNGSQRTLSRRHWP